MSQPRMLLQSEVYEKSMVASQGETVAVNNLNWIEKIKIVHPRAWF